MLEIENKCVEKTRYTERYKLLNNLNFFFGKLSFQHMALNIYALHHRYLALPFSLYRLFIASKLMPSQRTFFLSCNDVITLDFRLLKHDSIIVKSEKHLARKSCFVQNKSPPHFLSISKQARLQCFQSILVLVQSVCFEFCIQIRCFKRRLLGEVSWERP